MADRNGRAVRTPGPGEPVSSLLPDRPTLAVVREVAAGCKVCDLYKRGTQAVPVHPSSILRAVQDLHQVAGEIARSSTS